MRFRAACVLAVSAVICSVSAAAQTAAAATQVAPDSTPIEDIVVVGAATQRSPQTYARTISSGPMGRLSPRWNDRLCVRVINLDAEHAALLKDRIETVARAIGLSPEASPTCLPDIAIYATDDPDALAATLIETAPRSFRPARRSVTLGDEALESFRTSDAPVRWWQVSLPLMVDSGMPAITLSANGATDPMARSVSVEHGSRLRGNVRDDLIGVTIVIDTGKLNDVPFGAVSDYIAFVALAPADPRIPTGDFDTVLNLFDRTGVTGLTSIDEDYLYALYTASRAPTSAALQAAEIAHRMEMERRRRNAANTQAVTVANRP